MESSELERVIKVYSLATASLIYCFHIVSRIPKGRTRLISILPVVVLFTLLPFSLRTFHLRGLTAFFLLWLGNFKLLLFAFHQGPLSQTISFTHFLASALFPINTSTSPTRRSSPLPLLPFLTKLILLFFLIIYVFQLDYKHILHPNLVLLLYCFFMYLAMDIAFAIAVLPVKLLLGHQFDLDPQFNEPYFSTSLQDFWGRRWNLMVTTILRPSVYHPVRRALAPCIGPMPASLAATLAVFAVSGLMHELMWFCLTGVRPTWEVTGFFMLHGVCTAAEMAVKRAVGRRVTVPAFVSTPLTLGFLALTGKWLFFPQLLRNGVDEWVIKEYAPLVQFVRRTMDGIIQLDRHSIIHPH